MFRWQDPDVKPEAGSCDAAWIFTPDDSLLYDEVTGTVRLTVRKAVPTGEPEYTMISEPGKTLADAAITTQGGTLSVEGSVAWEQDPSTEVEMGKAYGWTFTPTDSRNYENITGSVVLWTDDGKPHVHTWGDWVVVKPAACTEDGDRMHTCTGCNAVEHEKIPALGHDYKDGVCTRCATAVTVLYRAADSPKVAGGNPFTDVPVDSYYYIPVTWAWNEGITLGVSETSFSPDGILSHEQLVTFLCRFARRAGLDTSTGKELTGCPDVQDVSEFSLDSMKWAVGFGLVDTGAEGRLEPLAGKSRVQVCKMMWRLLTAIG